MRKFATLTTLTFVLAGILIPSHIVFAWGFGDMFKDLMTGIAQLLMSLASLALIFSGAIFDWIMQFTIVDMARNIGGPTGVGASITSAWATLRDVANMVFIFVLLYGAFKAMFDAGFGGFFGTTVKNIIIAALLINFSLFLSKVVIDASNVVATGFYNSISTNSQPLGSNRNVVLGGSIKGIAGGYAKMLGIQTLYSANILNPTDSEGRTIKLEAGQILVIGIMTSAFLLIVAVIMLIVGVMFAARFIILVFIMILSSLAVIAYIIPGQKGLFDKWKSALIDQSFFAPLYFGLTWVVFKLGNSLRETLYTYDKMGPQSSDFSNIFNNPQSAVALLINYVLIIGFSIAALIFAKSMASKTAYFGAISGGIGTGVMGGTALLGRQTFGRAASRLEKSQRFQRLAATHSKTFGTLYSGTQKMARGSFDIRSSDTIKKVPGLGKEMDILGTPSKKGEGGFNKYREEKTKKVIDKGKQFTDRQARVNYARRIASKIGTYRGSAPNNIPSLFGTMGRSNRIAAATLLDERIKELRGEIGTARGELNTYRNTMGIAGTPGVPPTAVQLALLSPYEQGRYNLLTDPSTTRSGSVANLNQELTDLQNDRTTYGLDNTLRQQF